MLLAARECFLHLHARSPASSGPEPRPASPVNVFGKVSGGAALFRRVRGGARMHISRVGEKGPIRLKRAQPGPG